MNKTDIKNNINLLKGYIGEQYVLLAGSSLVMHDVKEETKDIDISLNEDAFTLLKNKLPFKESVSPVNGQLLTEIYFCDIIIDVGTNCIDCGFDIIDGIKCASLKEIILFKENLGRDKDIQDIALIEQYLNK